MSKNILFYGNCQSAFLALQFRVLCVSNFEFIKKGQPLPLEEFRKADVLIYQPLGPDYGEYSTDFLLREVCKPNIASCSFPYIIWHGYFPTMIQEKWNDRSRSDKFPFGIFPWSCSQVSRMVQEGKQEEEITQKLENLENDDYFSVSCDISRLRHNETSCDIKVCDFILENFRQKQLFYIPNHPTLPLFSYLITSISSFLSIPKPSYISPSFEYFQLPIYPKIKEELKLLFESHIILFDQKMSLKEWISFYKRTYFLYNK